eukprot:2412619-Prymnesium_polylepis.2
MRRLGIRSSVGEEAVQQALEDRRRIQRAGGVAEQVKYGGGANGRQRRHAVHVPGIAAGWRWPVEERACSSHT